MTNPDPRIAQAVAEVSDLLTADGAALDIVSADLDGRRLQARMRFTRIACADCILPGPMIVEFLQSALAKYQLAGFGVSLEDPRDT